MVSWFFYAKMFFSNMDKLDKIMNRIKKIEKRIEELENLLESNTDVIEEELDPLVPDAIQYILEKNSVSSAELQKHLNIGYARTARILDELCELGFIEEFDHGNDSRIIKKDEISPFQAATEDSRLIEAVKIIKKHELVSTALLQRSLKIGYAHAKALLDELEELGYIGPDQGESKPRIVLDRTKKKPIARN